MHPYRLSDDIWLCERAAYLPRHQTLVVADLQIGQEQQLRAMGHNIPYEQARKMFLLLHRLLKQTGAKRLVIDGDLKHEFGRISGQERGDILGMLRELKKRVEIVLVKGNHDTITQPLADELGIPLVDAYAVGDVLCVHGHREPAVPRGIKTIIIGHLHPAIALHDGVRKEKYACFLAASYRRKRLVVLPSLSTMTDGADVLTVQGNSPLLPSLEKAEVYVLADEIRAFGRIGRLRKILSD